MRKQTKLVAALSATALLAVGASMTSFAKGWTEIGDGEYVYLDSDGERVTSEWRRSGSDYFFLDENGEIAKSRLITPDDGDTDAYYYVNSIGARLKNQWARVINEEGDTVNDETPEMFWYYLGQNGKAIKAEDDAEFKKVAINYAGANRLFFFDAEGRMVTGWIEYEEKDGKKNIYYCNPDDEAGGYALTGWWELEVPDDWDSAGNKEYDVVEWFYFDGGKMKRGESGKPAVWYKDGWYYSFDENGVLLDDWYQVDVTGTSNNVEYATTNTLSAFTTYIGTKQGTGWIYTDKDDDGDYKHYYLVAFKERGSDGKEKTVRNVAFNSLQNDGLMRAKTINGKVYLFDDDGIMLTGVKTLNAGNTALVKDELGGAVSRDIDAGIYFFNNASGATRGQMMTGKQTVTEDGETNTYYFYKETGKAATNAVIDGYLYGNDGRRIEAENGNSYEVITLDYAVDIKRGTTVADTIPAKSKVIVSSNGKLKTSANGFTKVDGEQYKVVKPADDDTETLWDVITKEEYDEKNKK